MADANRIGTEIRDARVAHDWTQSELAEKAHVSERMIWDLENGTRKPQAAKLDAVRRVLGLDASAQDTWASWDGYSQGAAFMVGAIFHAMEPDERVALHAWLTPALLTRRDELLAQRERTR